MTPQQQAVIRGLKKLGPAPKPAVLIIKDENGTKIGTLEPVSGETAAKPEIISFLTKWRKMFMKYFMTQFKATEERTKQWLEEVVLPDDSKILFLILEENGHPIGNYAVRDISDDQAELDNLIRGEKGGHPRLIYFAEKAMLHWLFNQLGMRRVVLKVFSNNAKTIALHTSTGFTEVGRFGLSKIVAPEGIRYEMLGLNQPGNTDFQIIQMELKKGVGAK